MSDAPDAAAPYERYWDSLAALRAWRTPFQATVEAVRRADAEAQELTAQAAKLAGGSLPAVGIGRPNEDAGVPATPAAALEALRARVADLRLFAEVVQLREAVGGWIDRAGEPAPGAPGGAAPDAGPLSVWAVGARGRLAEIDGWIDAAAPAGLTTARDQLDGLMRGLDGVRRGLLDQVDANRAAAAEVVSAYDEACHLVLQDAAALHARLGAVGRGEQGESARILVFMGVSALVGGVAGLAYVYVREAMDAMIPAVGGGLLVGLGLGLGMWVWRLRSRTTQIRTILTEARALRQDAAAAQVQVRSELEGLQRAAAGLGAAARALRTEISVPDHSRLLAQVDVPAETQELGALITRAEGEARPDVVSLGVAAGVFTFMLGIAGVILWAPSLSAVDPEVETPPTVAAPAGTAGSPAAEVPAPPAADPRPAPPVAEVAPTFRSGDWSGTLGPWRVAGTLTAAGSAVTGTLTLSGPEGVQQCVAQGTLTGTRLSMKLPGCPQHASLSGKLARSGNRITGTGKSTVTFQGQTMVADDVWEMKAE